jgi:hypothetical protein
MTSNLNSLHRRRQLCNEKPDSQSSSAGKLIMQKIPKWTKSIKSFSFAGKRTKKQTDSLIKRAERNENYTRKAAAWSEFLIRRIYYLAIRE